jgi:hypothetical protein
MLPLFLLWIIWNRLAIVESFKLQGYILLFRRKCLVFAVATSLRCCLGWAWPSITFTSSTHNLHGGYLRRRSIARSGRIRYTSQGRRQSAEWCSKYTNSSSSFVHLVGHVIIVRKFMSEHPAERVAWWEVDERLSMSRLVSNFV